MLRFISLFILCIIPAIAATNPNFSDPKNCIECHEEQVKDWKTSWHARSHEDNNPLFSAMITYIQKTTHQPRASVTLKCARCHNPKISVKQVNKAYMYAKAFGVETKESAKIDQALSASHAKNGISCHVCHTTDALHSRKTDKDVGSKIIKWSQKDTIVGPFEGNNRANFHKSEQREHFVKGNSLCLTCHQGSGNLNALPGYETGVEIARSGDNTRCVECHMSTKKKMIIAPHITKAGEAPKMRQVRSHFFAGARNSDILKNTLSLYVDNRIDGVSVQLQNLTPHKAPTGFSGRSLRVEVIFLKGNQVLQKKQTDLRMIYLDKNRYETVSYIADKLHQDNRLKPNEKRALPFPKPKGTTAVKVNVWYYLLAPTLQPLLRVKDPIFTKRHLVVSQTTKL